MFIIYNFAIHIVWIFLKIIGIFNPKIKQFVNGRSHTMETLKDSLAEKERVIWMHVASLGEFEQGLPVLKQLRETYASHKLLVTFFSPSGYEVKKNTPFADVVTYLPIDTRGRAKRFLDTVRPELAIFVKYEIWPNYLRFLSEEKVPVLLISALFTKKKIFFKFYGGFMRKALRRFRHIFVQEESSRKVLQSFGFNNVTVSGDTRFDRVSEIAKQNNHLHFMESFKGLKLCLVGGSTWPDDERILVEFINSTDQEIQFVLAPHNIKQEQIQSLKNSIHKKVLLYSDLEESDALDGNVLIVDVIGLLTKIYSYADIAYVGGGFGTGLHNTLEPAVFGIPILIGPEYGGFNEARELVSQGGIETITDYRDFSNALNRFIDEPEYRRRTGLINQTYVRSRKGASVQIMAHIRTLL